MSNLINATTCSVAYQTNAKEIDYWRYRPLLRLATRDVFGSIGLKKGSRKSTNCDFVCFEVFGAGGCHDGLADERSEPTILSVQP
jgi:hypothetical protein